MKTVKTYIKSFVLLSALCAGFSSCDDQPTAFELADGVPTLHFVRYADRDIAISQAYMEEAICLVGENLRSVHKLFFNDQQAVLNTSFITDHTLLVSIPGNVPEVTTDSLYMVTKSQDTVKAYFRVLPPSPVVKSLSNEWAAPGQEVTLYGDYFIGSDDAPITVEFPNGTVTDFIESSKTALKFIVPATATEGKIKVNTMSGSTYSVFHYRDSRGMITNFDGATDVVPQGWNIAATYSDVEGVDGQYVVLGPDTLSEGGDWNEKYKLPFWCGNWNGDPMSIKSGAGVPICNIVDFTNFANMALKFELCIPASNPWSAGAMQLVFTSADKCANDAWQNNTYIHTVDAGGYGLCRGLYMPWKETGSFDTAGKWITVTVPFSEFKYNADGSEGLVPLSSPEDFASFILWPWSGGVIGTECSPIFKIDNIRAVPVR